MALSADSTIILHGNSGTGGGKMRPSGSAFHAVKLPVAASVTVYEGAQLVWASGYVTPASGDTADKVGWAMEQKDNGSGAAGALEVNVCLTSFKLYNIAVAGVTSHANNGSKIYCATDDIGDASLTQAGNEPAVGEVLYYRSTGYADVLIYSGAGGGGASTILPMIDVDDFATGTAGVLIPLNVANAWEIKDTSYSYLRFVSTTGSMAVRVGQTLDLNNHLDLDHALTGTGDLANITGTISHATQLAEGLDISIAQLTNARTSGTVDGLKIATTSLAGDSGGVYNNIELAITDGGGSATHNGILFGAGIDNGLYFGNLTTDINVQHVGTTATHIIDVIDAFTGMVIETGTYASEASKGIALASGNLRPVSLLFDDAGAALGAADYRPLLSRVYLSVDQANAITINAIRGHLKAADLVDISSASSVVSPLTGYLELSGTGARSLSGHVAAIRAAVEEGASGTTTIEASSFYAGVEATLNSTRTYTTTGKMAAFVANISGGTSKWPLGLYMPGSDVVIGGLIGTFAGSGATTGGIPFAAAQNIWSDGQASTFEVHGASTANLTSAYCTKVGRFRHIVNCTTAEHETYGLMGQCVVQGTTLSHLHAGLIGTFEGHTSGVVLNSPYQYGAAGLMARVGGGGAITATTDIAGVCSFLNGADVASGLSVAFGGCDSGTAPWGALLGCSRATALLDLPAAGTAPVSTGGTVGTHGTATLKIAILIGGVTYYLLASTVPTFT